MTYRALVLPLKAPSAGEHPRQVARVIRKHRGSHTFLTEAYALPVRKALGAMKGYREVVGEGGQDQRRGQYDNPMMVEASLRNLGSGQLFGSARAKPAKFAPERWITFSVDQVPGSGIVCGIGIHPNATVQNAEGEFRRTAAAKRYQAMMGRLDSFLDMAEAMKWKVVVGGDVNYRDKGTEPLSPFAVLRKHGLTIHAHGLTVLACDPTLKLDVHVVTLSNTISDHVGLIAERG